MWIIAPTLVVSLLIGDVHCLAFSTVVEGESVMMDCGFQTNVDGGNLMWQIILTDDNETDLGHIVPGDHFCGTDAIACTLHTNGSITLINVTLDDGDKRYRCLRGDTEGYHYFSDVNLIVFEKESFGHPVIQPRTESKADVYMIEEKGVIHSYEQPTCEDKEDGALIVTCSPPSGVIVDKVYDQVQCNCTDSDGNSNSLIITVNSGHAELKENTTTVVVIVVIIIMCVTIVALVCIVIWCRHIYQLHKAENARNPENIDVCYSPRLGKGITGRSNRSLSEYDEDGQRLNLDTDDVSQRLNDKEAECRDKSDENAKLKEENQNKMRDYHRLYELIQMLTERETEFEAGLNKIPMTLKQQLRKHLLSQDKKEKKKAGGEDKDDAKPKEVTAVDQVKACKDDVIL